LTYIILGFTKEIGLSEKEWNIGFLKTYDAATLMHCAIEPNLNYLEITADVRQQHTMFKNQLKLLTGQHLIYPGVQDFREGTVVLALGELPGLQKAGWDATKFNELISESVQRTIYDQNKQLLDQIKRDTDVYSPFKAPVPELYPDDAAHYLSIIKDPIDLRTIEQNLNKGYYITRQMFIADLVRMVDNCMEFNPKKTAFHNLAEKLLVKYLRPFIAAGGYDGDTYHDDQHDK